MTEEPQKQRSRRDRILSNVRWIAVFVIAFVLLYRAFGPQRAALEALDRAGRDEAVTAPSATYFTDPAAQHLVVMGHSLMERPLERLYVARELETLAEEPAVVDGDPSLYLALRTAYWQLRRDPEVSGSYEAAAMLWDAADRLEARHQISSVSRSLDGTAPSQ